MLRFYGVPMRQVQYAFLRCLLLSCRTDKVLDESDGELPDDTNSSMDTDTDTGLPSDPDADEDGFPESEDCDDSNPAVHPEATEFCDDIDNDCDDEVDESDAKDATTWYIDSDGDGYGAEDESLVQCEAPSGYVAEEPDRL